MPRLVIRNGNGVGRDQVLGGARCTVGRDPGADFTLDDTLVSRRHFRVLQEGGVYWVEDLGSTNGTLINGRRSQRVQLVDGDVIEVGGTQVAFVQKDLLGLAGKPTGARKPIVAPAKSVPAKAVPPKAVSPKAVSSEAGQPKAPAPPVVRRRKRRR